MKGLSSETRQVQNAALGAYLQWRFACAYTDARRDAGGCPLLVLFIVLPILFHADLAGLVHETRRASGLRAFAGKFSASRNKLADLLLAIHDRIALMQSLSLQALQIAASSKLLLVDPRTASVLPLSTTDATSMPLAITRLGKASEKLGAWCADLTLHEVAEILKVRF